MDVFQPIHKCLDVRLETVLVVILDGQSLYEKKMATRLCFLALFALQLVGISSALRCHVCDSLDGPGTDYCAEVTSGVDSTDLTGNVSYSDASCDKYCIKTEVTRGPEYQDQADYVQSVARTCGSQCINYCYPLEKMEVCVHCCQTDLCNGACALNFYTAIMTGGWLLVTLLQTG
ncbi:uncharacterized protein LOC119725963 [Patiria miniata]|uniref:Uncharacterized protein n=1 Tax=Patiria miniata TaxID=46514 RepID=A0A913ZP02_PATMI|nr:uncharacterized protein LOC119725963 [Patiria miniata]